MESTFVTWVAIPLMHYWPVSTVIVWGGQQFAVITEMNMIFRHGMFQIDKNPVVMELGDKMAIRKLHYAGLVELLGPKTQGTAQD